MVMMTAASQSNLQVQKCNVAEKVLSVPNPAKIQRNRNIMGEVKVRRLSVRTDESSEIRSYPAHNPLLGKKFVSADSNAFHSADGDAPGTDDFTGLCVSR